MCTLLLNECINCLGGYNGRLNCQLDMEHWEKKSKYHIGMRNIKTALSVFICLVFYRILGREGDFLAVASAIICMQDSVEKSVKSGLYRILGTAFGTVLGILLLYIDIYFGSVDLSIILSSLGVVLLIMLLNAFGKQDAIVIGCIVYLAIVMKTSPMDPYLYGINRLIDTTVGISIAVVVNRFIRNPDLREKDTTTESQQSNETKERMKHMYQDMMDTIGFVKQQDPAVGDAMELELGRQRRNLELIASENLVSPAVMAAVGSVLTNKYAEGYPSKRYYGGCECVDIVENIAIDRLKTLFGCKFANVQPHSGAQANEAAYAALIQPGDKVLGMNLAQGGHLTHGSPVNFSGKLYDFAAYGVDPKTHRIDYDQVRKIALEVKPKLIVAGASAYPRAIDFAKFADIAKECGAYLMVDMAHIAGLVAAGEHMSPVPYAHITTSTTHKTLRGIRGGIIMTNDAEIAQKIDKAVFPGTQGGPLMHVIAAKAVGFGEALSDEFKAYQAQVVKNAKALADALLEKGFSLVSGGTDNHLILVDLTNFDITGKEFEKRLDEVYITVNKNSIPNETRSPFVTSGVRVGTAAVTTRGLKEADMQIIADCMFKAATDFDNQAESIRATVDKLCARFPLYA